ncbi:MAG: hypothetical protein LLG04_06290 [Parachlamydia sp.]|nr:hypothetical protein [Parachlamydia sp.]
MPSACKLVRKVLHIEVRIRVRKMVRMVVRIQVRKMVRKRVRMVLRKLVRMVHRSKAGRDRMTVHDWTSYGSNPPKVLLWLTKKRTRSSFPVVFSLKTPFVLSR